VRPAYAVAADMSWTLPALLERNIARQPDAAAFIDGERHVSYAEFDRLCTAAAAWLAEQGITAGDRVAVWMVNRIEWLALLFAAARVGAALVPVNTRYGASEVEYILARSGARLLLMEPRFRTIDFAGLLGGVAPAAVPRLERVILLGDAGAPPTLLDRPTIVIQGFAAGAVAPASAAAPHAPAVLFTTSGTTKGPKLVIHPQRTLALHSYRCAAALGLQESGANLLAAMPFCGVFGLTAALAALAGGVPIIVMDAFDAGKAAALLRRHAVTHTFGSDEMFRRLMALVPGPNPFPAARAFGFAAFSPGAAELAREAWHRRIPLHGLYGSSEVLALFAMQPASLPVEERIEGGGKPVSHDAVVRIREVDADGLLPAGQSGEIEIRAPTNFAGYLDDAPATAAALHADGFFRTGDIGRLREDGTFVFESRRGDAIRLGGFLVNPAEIEDVLKGIDGIADAQVVAAELDGRARAVAFVIPDAGSSVSEADVIALSGGRMASFKVPARVWPVDRFPTTQSANGTKIQRAILRAMAAERLGRERR
jgi:fatty-acyl-CoA synthase